MAARVARIGNDAGNIDVLNCSGLAATCECDGYGSGECAGRFERDKHRGYFERDRCRDDHVVSLRIRFPVRNRTQTLRFREPDSRIHRSFV